MPKGYNARQEITPEIAHIHVGRLQNGMIWMQSDLSPHRQHTVFFSGACFNQCRAPINFHLSPALIKIKKQQNTKRQCIYARDRYEMTPLHKAALHDRTAAAKYLLSEVRKHTLNQ